MINYLKKAQEVREPQNTEQLKSQISPMNREGGYDFSRLSKGD